MNWMLWSAAALGVAFVIAALGLFLGRRRQHTGLATYNRHRLEIERDTFRRIETERMQEMKAAGAPVWHPKGGGKPQ